MPKENSTGLFAQRTWTNNNIKQTLLNIFIAIERRQTNLHIRFLSFTLNARPVALPVGVSVLTNEFFLEHFVLYR